MNQPTAVPEPEPVSAPPLTRDGALTRVGRWSARLAEHCNPILVRVVRQELRNRAFVSVFALLLTGGAIAALVAATVAANDDHANSSGLARGFFGTIAAGWAFALGVVQPLGCFRAIASERNEDTWDLVELTGLRPLRVVGGLLLASLVQGLLYTSALAPFMVMAYLLRGIDLLEVLFVLILIPLGGIAAAALAVFMACLGGNKASRGFLFALLGLGLLGLWMGSCGLWFNLREISFLLDQLRSGSNEFWLVIAMWVNSWLAHIIIMLVFSSALLAFRAANRSTGPRLAWCALWLNGLAWAVIIPILVSEELSWALSGFAIGGMIHAGFLGLFAVSEDYELSPRQARSISEARGWRRPFMLLFGPGAARGRLAWLGLSFLTLGLALGGWILGGAKLPADIENRFTHFTLLTWTWTLFAWLAIVLVIGDRLYRGWMAGWFPTPALRRGFVLLLFALWMVVPPIVFKLLGFDLDGLLGWFSPWTALRLAGGFETTGTWPAFAAFSLVGLAALVVLFVQGMRQLPLVTHRIIARDDDRNPRGG